MAYQYLTAEYEAKQTKLQVLNFGVFTLLKQFKKKKYFFFNWDIYLNK